MKQKKSRFSTRLLAGISAGLILAGSGTLAAQAVTGETSSTIYVQEQSQWCWAAATKTIARHTGNGVHSQCQIVMWGLGSSSCPNQPGTFANIASAMTKSGMRTPGAHLGAVLSFTNVRAEIDSGRQVAFRWGWSDGTGHLLVFVGYDTSGSKLKYIDPTQSSYQLNSYSWIQSGSGHTWTDTIWQIYNN